MNECLKCKYRGKLVDSRHSQCLHPSILQMQGDHDVLYRVLYMLTHPQKTYELRLSDFKIVFSQPIGGEWTLFPFNFDPIWIKKCYCLEICDKYSDNPDIELQDVPVVIKHENNVFELGSEIREVDKDGEEAKKIR